MYAVVKDQSHLIGKVIGLLKIDSDRILLQTLFAIVLLWIVWPLVFLGYLATVYGPHILIGR
ncbi:hypothetical protein [Nitrospira sp. Nam74]